MNAPDKLQQMLSITREPFPASTKVHASGGLPGVRVPMREIALTNGERVTVYDTSGPYTDPTASIDVRRGLPDLRGPWVDARADTEAYDGRQRQAQLTEDDVEEAFARGSAPEGEELSLARLGAAGHGIWGRTDCERACLDCTQLRDGRD